MLVKRLLRLTLVGILILSMLVGCAPAVVEKEEMIFAADFAIGNLDDEVRKVTDAEGREHLLVPRGQTPPSEYAHLPVINIPIENVLLTSTSQASLITPLDVWPSVAGVSNSVDQWFIDDVIEGLEDGSIAYVGEAWSPDYEKIRLLNPELVFVYTGEFGLHDMITKLTEMEIPYVVVNDFLENDPRAEIEWMIFMSAFFDKYDEAKSFVEQAKSRIEEIKTQIEGRERPKVAWGFIWDGQAHVPNAGSHTAAMITLAGGDYVFADIGAGKGGTSTISLEEFYAKSKDADVLIYSSMLSFVPSIQAFLDQAPILDGIKSVSEDNVWAFTPEYFQMIHRRDDMIMDLAAIFYPDEFEPEGLYVRMPRN